VNGGYLWIGMLHKMKQIKSSNPYKDLCAEYYELDKPFASQDALTYYLGHAKKARGPILEPMCGTGRFLIPLVQAGFEVTGFDNSPHMLNICKAKCQDKKLQCKLLEVSFSHFNPTQKYKMVFISSGSFSLLTTPKEICNALSCINNILEEDGIFIFEVETLNAISKSIGTWIASWMKKKDDSLIVLNRASMFDEEASIETTLCRYEHWKNNTINQTEVEEFCLKLYKTQEIESLLNKQGFKVLKRLTPYSNKKAQDNAEIILYECIKKKEIL